MSYYHGWLNAQTMAKQGHAPKVAEMVQTIKSDPFSSCFFLSSLYHKKEEECKQTKPEWWAINTHEVARLRVEFILVEMYMHIKRVQKVGLHSMSEMDIN